MKTPIRVMLVDDHQIVIDGLKAVLNTVAHIEVVGEANSGKELFEVIELLKPELVIMDVDMPEMDGKTATTKLKQTYPYMEVIALTMHHDRGVIQAMTRAGAKGYLLKNTSRKELIEAIDRVAEGKQYFGAEVTQSLLQATPAELPSEAEPFQLTTREHEILVLIAEGFSNTEIGDRLHISHRTVDTHRTNLMKKIGAKNIAGLIRYAFQKGLV
ncbi:MAG: response regulator transcription factor [Bacteroidota bacterium]